VSDREWAQTNAGRGAIAVLAASIVLALWTLVHAIRIAPVPEIAAPQFAASGALTAGSYGPTVDVAAAVERDPFAADRTAPANRYRAPGEESDDGEPKAPPVEPVVLGTASSDPAHAFATIQLADSHATIMHVGDKIGQYTVKSIERGHVVFTTPSGKKLDIPELQP
jgi:hypothetical protein